ncbi:PEGA domain-containing protein [Patescibacteria group bacterium]|nr:MAG: PEGA domain-containing protein [Patescibacteria group bacterium]
MRNHLMMAALGAAFLVSACGGDGGNMTPPPADCETLGPDGIREGCSELRLTSMPGGVAVRVDGMALGATPTLPGETLNWRGPFGTVTVEATLDGYEPYMEDVLLRSGSAVSHDVALVPTASAMGTLDVSADVGGGTLVVDGTERGTMDTMPMAVMLPEGMHRIEVQAVPGHVASWDEVTIVRGETSAVMISVGRDIGGSWSCEIGGFRVVVMDATFRNIVAAQGLDIVEDLAVNGNRLSSSDGMISGTISADGQSLEYTFTGPGGSYTERCTR